MYDIYQTNIHKCGKTSSTKSNQRAKSKVNWPKPKIDKIIAKNCCVYAYF